MAVWKQETYVDDDLKYKPSYLSDGELAARFAQMLFLNQAGENIELQVLSKNDMLEITAYKAIRKLEDRTVVHIYTMIIEDHREVI